MKLVAPKRFTYKGGDKAVLLLHGFTENTGDVRRLVSYLQDRGFTCHGPLYKGHGIGLSHFLRQILKIGGRVRCGLSIIRKASDSYREKTTKIYHQNLLS